MTHIVVLGFAWLAGLMLGISGANLRRERLKHSLATIGIMAHELRTPLSTAGLIADALLMEARRQPDGPRAGKLEKLGQRLHALTRSMNHHIDMQISNARLLQLSHYSDRISARELVTEVVAAFPYRTTRESNCIEVIIHNDFQFRGAHAQFLSVLDNLIQNALRSLQASSSVLNPGDLRIEVGSRGREGRITVSPIAASASSRPPCKEFSSRSSRPTTAPDTAWVWHSANAWCIRPVAAFVSSPNLPVAPCSRSHCRLTTARCRRSMGGTDMSFPIYRRPGGVVFLDDDPAYLEMLAEVMPEQWSVRLFVHPDGLHTLFAAGAATP